MLAKKEKYKEKKKSCERCKWCGRNRSKQEVCMWRGVVEVNDRSKWEAGVRHREVGRQGRVRGRAPGIQRTGNFLVNCCGPDPRNCNTSAGKD